MIFDADTAQFGAPTDLDDNDRVVVLVTKALNDANEFFLGFVAPTDVRTPQECASSNEAEIFYTKAPDPTGSLGNFSYTVATALEDAPPLIAHEFVHIIQVGRRRVINDTPFMAAFMAEGQAQIGEEVVGHVALGNETGQNYGSSIALSSPNDWYLDSFSDLGRYFGENPSDLNNSVDGAPHECSWLTPDPFPCQGEFRPLWYGVNWSLLRWANDQFGPSFAGGAPGIQKAIIDNDKTGLSNLANVLGVQIDSLLAQWSATLYLDDRISGLSPRLTFPSWSLFSILDRGLSASARLKPAEITFSEFLERVDVRAASTAYFLIGGANRPATALRVRDTTDEELPTSMQVYLVRVQ